MPRSIRAKLFLAFAIMTVITGALGIWCILQMRALSRINLETYDRPLMAINYARAADTTFEQLANDALKPVLAAQVAEGGEDPAESLFGDLDVAEQRASSPAAVADIRQLRRLAHRWLALKGMAGAVVHGPVLADLANEIRKTFDQLVEQMADDGFVNRRKAVMTAESANRLSIVMTGMALVMSLLLTFLLARRVARPLTAATAVADRIAAGHLETEIPAGGSDEAGMLLSSLAFMQGRIREMVEAEAARRRSAQGRLIEALESSTEGMLLLDRAGHVLIANTRASDMLAGISASIHPGLVFRELFAASDRDWASLLSTPGEVLLPNGTWIAVSRQETVDGGSFLILSDITLRKEYERKLKVAAYQDPLTGLHNRVYLFERFDDAAEGDHPVLFIVNIDRFRQINGAHGIKTGDLVLQYVAECLWPLASDPKDVCARINGDEFVLWLADCDADRAAAVSSAILARSNHPVDIGDVTLKLRLRLGVALADKTSRHGQELLRDARVALDQVKHMGGDQGLVFSDSLREQSRVRSRIEADLPDAIATRQLYVEYQPLILLETGRVAGVEALARWRHPELGQIPPMRFVSVAEDSGAIIDLGRFMLHEAATQGTLWVETGAVDESFTIAVNLSPRQLVDARSARQVLDYLERQQGAAKRLKLEITESVLLGDPTEMIALLNAFKACGVELSLDDFGTGFSSLSYLHKFPFDVLKIDRSFVQDIETDGDALRLVRTIIELGQDLGMRIVAEGVETAFQADRLREFGCDYGQGYYFSRPIDAAAATAFLAHNRPCPAFAVG